jgi:hypothetical protein
MLGKVVFLRRVTVRDFASWEGGSFPTFRWREASSRATGVGGILEIQLLVKDGRMKRRHSLRPRLDRVPFISSRLLSEVFDQHKAPVAKTLRFAKKD